MTRINCVDPAELADRHLFAEYREITRVPSCLRRALDKRSALAILVMIPKDYVLGTGHVTFFYDKLGHLIERHGALRKELLARGYQLGEQRPYDVTGIPEAFVKAWTPGSAAIALSRARIAERIAAKPHLYRWTPRRAQP